MPKALTWLLASIVALLVGSVSRIWLGDAGSAVGAGCSAVGLACAATAFITWFRESQRGTESRPSRRPNRHERRATLRWLVALVVFLVIRFVLQFPEDDGTWMRLARTVVAVLTAAALAGSLRNIVRVQTGPPHESQS